MKRRDILAYGIIYSDLSQVADHALGFEYHGAVQTIVVCGLTVATVYSFAAFWDYLGRKDRDACSHTSD